MGPLHLNIENQLFYFDLSSLYFLIHFTWFITLAYTNLGEMKRSGNWLQTNYVLKTTSYYNNGMVDESTIISSRNSI